MLETETEEIVMSDIKKQAKKPQYFDPEKWLVRWNNVYNNKTRSFKERKVLLKRLMKEIDISTDKVCKGDDFILESKKWNLLEHHLRTAVNQTIKYDYEFLFEKVPKLQENGRTTTHFVKRDMLDVGLFIDFEFKKNPLIMISADTESPGGTDYGLFGMEPNVWRRTALRECLDPMRRKKYMGLEEDKFEYSIQEDQVIYCPSVPVFRTDIKSGFAFTTPTNLSFIMVSPLYRPTLQDEKFTEEDREKVRKKIEMVFMTAILYGHHHIIVSAFGCGKAKNPPSDVAEIFVDTIKKYRHYPLNVNFALIDDKIHENNFRGNVYPFSKVYKTLRKKKQNKILSMFKRKAGNPN